MRIKHRWAALDAENEAIERSRKTGSPFQQETLQNGDTIKQLLARSRYVLYKNSSNWTASQKTRAELLFDRYPDLKTAYGLSMGLSQIFENTKDKIFGLANLARWHERVRQTGLKHSIPLQGQYRTTMKLY